MIKKRIRDNCPGMTIIEMLMVLAIISIMSAISLFYVNSDNFRLNSEARNIRSTLMQAKTEAVKRNVSTRVNFSVSGYEWVIPNDNGEIILGSHSVHENIMIKSKDLESLTSQNNYITFSPRGTSNNPHIKVANNMRHFSIRVTSAGRIFTLGPNEN